jgi:ribonuclease HI
MPPKRKYFATKPGPKFYAVLNGRDGSKCIYESWGLTYKATTHMKQCKFKSFDNKEDAEKFLGEPPYIYVNASSETKQNVDAPSEAVNPPSGSKQIVYCDGGCDGNGTEFAVGGVGVYYGPDDPRNICVKVVKPNPTNNRCELLAAIMALSGFQREADGLIRTDSAYTISWFTKETPSKETPNFDLIQQLHIQRDVHPNVTLEWVEAHCGIPGNEGADQLTKLARS